MIIMAVDRNTGIQFRIRSTGIVVRVMFLDLFRRSGQHVFQAGKLEGGSPGGGTGQGHRGAVSVLPANAPARFAGLPTQE